jgi:hypothetical protein
MAFLGARFSLTFKNPLFRSLGTVDGGKPDDGLEKWEIFLSLEP